MAADGGGGEVGIQKAQVGCMILRLRGKRGPKLGVYSSTNPGPKKKFFLTTSYVNGT